MGDRSRELRAAKLETTINITIKILLPEIIFIETIQFHKGPQINFCMQGWSGCDLQKTTAQLYSLTIERNKILYLEQQLSINRVHR